MVTIDRGLRGIIILIGTCSRPDLIEAMTPPRQNHRRHFDEPGHAHELTFSCYRRNHFLRAERTRGWLIDAIDRARHRWGFLVWAYVLMPEHAHLIVGPGPGSPQVRTILAAIKQPVGRRALAYLEAHASDWLPRLTRVRGGRAERLFWQPGGGYDRNIVEPRTLHRMIEYVHLNPVRRDLVERPSDWRWSSAAWYRGGPAPPLQPDPIPPEWGLDDSHE